MSFSYSGGTITQTGTDTSLSGLTGVTGVSKYSNGGTSPLNRDTYDLSSSGTVLVINGTLSFDPANEELWLPGTLDALVVGAAGSLTVGGSETTSEGTSYTKEQGIFFDTPGASHIAGSGGRHIYVNAGGVYNWNGGVITLHAGNDFLKGGTINSGTLRQGTSLSTATSSTYATFLTDVTINDLTIDGLTRLVFTDANVQINSINLIHTAGLFASGSTVGESLTSLPPVGNYSADYQERDFSFWRGGKMRLRNSAVGSNAICLGSGTSVNNTGILEIQQDLTMNAATVDGVNISGGIYWIRDYNNGNRQNAGYTGGNVTANTAVDLTADKTYTGSFTNGVATELITTAYANRTTDDTTLDTSEGSYDTGPNRYDRRTINDVQGGVNLDQMDIFVWSYGSLPQTLTPSLIGLGGTEVDFSLLNDPSISESDKSIVDAYSTIETLDKLYDRSISWKIDSSNIEYPAADERLFEAGGGVINTSGRNIIIDDAAGTAFSVNTGTNTVTIKATNLGPGENNTSLQVSSTFIATEETISCDLNIRSGGVVSAQDNQDLTGNVNINSGGQIELTDLVSYQLQGTGNEGGKIKVNGASTSQTLDLRSYTIASSGFQVENSSGIDVTIKLTPLQTNPLSIETSGTISFDNTVPVTAELIDGTRVQLYNTDKSVELENVVVSGGSGFIYNADPQNDANIDIGDTLRLRHSWTEGISAKHSEQLTGILGVDGLSFSTTQVDDDIYNLNGIDGSTVTEFIADYPNVEIDVSGNTTSQRVYAWFVNNMSTADGIRDFFDAVDAEDEQNYVIQTNIVDLYFDNVSGASINLTGFIRRLDGLSPESPTSVDSIHWDNQKVYTATDVRNNILTLDEEQEIILKLARLIPAGL